MKKTILISLGLLLLLAACDRKAFVKKLAGTYTLDKYLYDGRDNSYAFDTTFREWQLLLTDGELYNKTWKSYFIFRDSLFVSDTIGFDSSSMNYIIVPDTFRFMDTTVTEHFETGKWDLINSEEDLQLRNDSTNAADIYRILELKKNNLTLRKGNEELYLVK